MRPVALDGETCLIRPAQLAPPLVCITWQEPGKPAGIEHHSTVEPRLRAWLEDPNVLLVGHNIAFDLAVIAERFPALRDLIFAAYRANRVTDTMIRQQLLDIAAGVYRGRVDAKGFRIVYNYDLESLARRNAGLRLEKDGWRLSYSEFIDTPLSDWPARAREIQAKARVRLLEVEQLLAGQASRKAKDRDAPLVKALGKERDGLAAMIGGDPNRCTEYALDDARATLAVYEAQEKHAKPYLADQFRQARAAWALYLSSAWGICVDKEGVEILKAKVEEERDELEEELQQLGLVREDGTRDTKLAKARMVRVCREEGLSIVRTEAHFANDAECGGADECEEHVCLDADACERSGDDVLVAYATRTTLTKQLTNDIPALEKGVLYPVHTRYGLAATGRSTSSKPNIQNQSKREGYREAFIARKGTLFAECDFPSLELYTLAQCCVSWLGQSKLAEALNNGLDPHLWFAASMLGIDYAEAKSALKDHTHPKHGEVKRARQLAKPANFGFPGGMGVPKFVTATRKSMGRRAFEDLFGTTSGEQERRVRQLKEQWFAAWPEMPHYFARVNALCDTDDGRANVETLFTGRWRGQSTYCAACNNGFQALGSDCAKRAAFLIADAQYAQPSSPLFNTRTVAFVHDEFIVEVPANDAAHDAAYALAERMATGANEFLPDVPIPLAKMEPLLMKRWSKKAEPRFDHNGRLIAWGGVK